VGHLYKWGHNMTSTTILQTGAHTVQMLELGLIHVVLRGDVSTDDARVMSDFFGALPAIPYRRYLIDIRAMGSIGPEGRKLISTRPEHAFPAENVTVDLGFVGATVRTKVLTTVVLAAATLATDITFRSLFFHSEEEAVAWAGVPLSPLPP